MRIAIHQPNYLPWIGYFHKMKDCDKFVIFDDVQLPTGNPCFETRTKIKTANGPIDLILPIKGRGNKILIKDAELADDVWRVKHLKTLKLAYQTASCYKDYIGGLEIILGNAEWKGLTALNATIIRWLAQELGIGAEIILSSELNIDSQGQQKIIDIVKKLGGNEYVSGSGAGSRRYIKEEDFKTAGIKLIWQDYSNPIYPQLHGQFIPRLSAIDLLFNTGDVSNHYF